MREVDLIGRIQTPITLNARMNANAVTTTNYNELGNKPKINGVTLYGDLTPEELGIFYGAPFVANTVAEMTNTDKVYVYTGSETGYVAGNWYYYNGSAWVSGGVYNSAAVQTDRTLTQEDKAADAKAVGDALAMKAGIIEDTVTGEIVSFVPDKTIDKLLDASLEMSPIQSLNGYDSPWPAGGVKNKLPTLSAATTLNGVTWTPNSNGTITANGTATANSVIDLGRGTLTLAAGTYTTNQSVSGAYDVNVFRLVNGSGVIHAQGGGTFTLTESASVFVRFAVLNGTTVNNVVIEPMLESGTSKTAFSPYSNICPISGHTGAELNIAAEYDAEDATTYSVTFTDQGAVYGGTYDFVTGKLTVTHAGKLGSEFTWQYNATYKIGYTYMTGKKPGRTNIISSAYKTVDKPSSTMLNGEMSGANNDGVNVKDDSTSTLEEFQAAVANVQFVYALATPLEYTLSPQQLTTLLGVNNVWGNGTATVKYAADAKTYIDNKIAAAVAALS